MGNSVNGDFHYGFLFGKIILKMKRLILSRFVYKKVNGYIPCAV